MRLKELQYRMRLRKILHDASIEELNITKEEIKREFEKRNKKK